MAVVKTGHWFEEPVFCSAETFSNCVGQYREDMLDPVESTFRFLLNVAIGVSVVLCILAYKWRFLADFCIHLEAIVRLIAQFFPNQRSESQNPTQHCMIGVGLLVLYYSDGGGSMFFLGL